MRIHPTQYGSQGQAAEQSRRGQAGKRGAHAAPRLVLQGRLQASMDHLVHHCDRADDCGRSRNQASRGQEGPSGPRGRHHPQRSVEPQPTREPTRGGRGGRGLLVGVHAHLPGVLRKSKVYEELDKRQSWWETYEPDEIVELNPDPKTMRMSASKPPTPKKNQPQGDPASQPTGPPKEGGGPAEAAAQAKAPAAAAQEEEAPALAAAAQEEDAPAPPPEEEAQAAAPQEGETREGEGAAPKEEEAPEGANPEGDPSAQEEGDTAPAAAGAEDQRAAWEKQWESEVMVTNIKETTRC